MANSFGKRPAKILVVDDDMFNRDLLRAYLENAGYQVIEAINGEAGWEAVQQEQPDLALIDIQMPLLDGIALCARIKNDRRFQFLPVVIVTAIDAEEERLRAVQAGADDFIGKPFNSLILLTRVRSLLRLKWVHDELERRNQLLRQVLNRYVDREIASAILSDPEQHLKLGGVSRQVVVLFADLRGFTRFTEQHDAVFVVETLNLVFNELTEVVFRHGGTFDKYLGDAIMAFYGAPLPGEDDVQRALRTCLEMRESFDRLRREVYPERLRSLGLGIGIHAGEAIVGNVGSERLMDYTVIGDVVNVARRLQEIARPGEILISGEVVRLVPSVRARFLAEQPLPGRVEPIALYEFEGID